MTQHVRNILKVYRRATESDTINGVEWYDRAKREAQRIAEYTNINIRTVVGVMAALSPNNRWERNVRDTEVMCERWVNGDSLDSFKVSCYNTMKAKAWSILDDELDDDDDILTRLNGQKICLLYTSPSPRDGLLSRMPSSA